MFVRHGYKVLMSFMALFLSSCTEEVFIELAPTITIDPLICTTGGGTDNCVLDFGAVALSTRIEKEISITNNSSIDLELEEPKFSDASDPSFRVEYWPDSVGSGLTSNMVVSFRPLVQNATTAELQIYSNARNMNNQPVRIELRGSGVDGDLPQIEIQARTPCVGTYPGSTEATDFGITGVGYPVACDFEIFNNGRKDLVIEEIRFDEQSDSAFEFVGRTPGRDPVTGELFESVVPPPIDGQTSSRTFTVRGVPGGLGLYRAFVLVQSNDPTCLAAEADGSCAAHNSRTLVRIPVQVEGAHTPTAVADILSVNGDTQFDIRRIEPLDDVMLTAEGSYASSRTLRIVEYKWEIINQPVGSHGFLDDPGSVTPRFVFDNSNNIVPGVDIAGFWSVKLTVLDSRDAHSVNEAIISFNAVPTDAIHIQLVWDHPNSDVDLHLLRDISEPGSTVPEWQGFDDTDCYYANCKQSSGCLDWFGSGNESNPCLDVDDIYGFGPENINIELPSPGRYLAAVHYFGDHGEGDTVAMLRLFLFGNLHSEYAQYITNHDWWEIAIIEWPSRVVETVDEVTPNVSSF